MFNAGFLLIIQVDCRVQQFSLNTTINFLLYQVIYRNQDNKINMTTKVFDKNDPSINRLIKENITYDPTSQEYEQYLKDNNI